MHLLQLHAVDLHNVLGRVLDRMRVSGLQLVAVVAELDDPQPELTEGWVVSVRIRSEDSEAVDRLACAAQKIVGVNAVRTEFEPEIATTPVLAHCCTMQS